MLPASPDFCYPRNARQVRNLPLLSDSTLPKADQMRLGRTIAVELLPGLWLVIPRGYVTDLFSVYSWLQSFFKSYDNRINLAAVVHDYLYEQWEEFARQARQQGYVLPTDSRGQRAFADQMMLDIMLRYRDNGTVRLYYRAVRLGGGRRWKKYRTLNALHPTDWPRA